MADIRVRVGQQNSIKVVSALTGQQAGITTSASSAHVADYAYVAGIATNIAPGSALDGKSLNITGISTFSQPIQYSVGNYNGPNGIAYFNNDGKLVSGPNVTASQDHTNNAVLTVDLSGNPIWANAIDGGSY
jgi:hypothetical protein